MYLCDLKRKFIVDSWCVEILENCNDTETVIQDLNEVGDLTLPQLLDFGMYVIRMFLQVGLCWNLVNLEVLKHIYLNDLFDFSNDELNVAIINPIIA